MNQLPYHFILFCNFSNLKKIASILLLWLLLFNLFGYRLLISTLLDRADKGLEARLDNNSYDDSQLISFKVPITRLSYYNPSDQWERIDGSIEIGDVYYKYVKRRIFNDSLEVMCVPNPTATELQAMKRKASHPVVCKIPLPEPYLTTELLAVGERPFIQLIPFYYYSVNFPHHPHPADERPPSFPA